MKKTSLLWEIRPKGQAAPISYLFGTMHLSNPRVLALLPTLQPFLKSSQAFAAEFDLGQQDPQRLQTISQFPPDQSLSHWLKPKYLKKLDHCLEKELGLSLQGMEGHKPFFFSNLLQYAQMRDQNQAPLDAQLQSLAEKLGCEILGLETFDEQLHLLEKIPLSYQTQALKNLLKNWSKQQQTQAKLLEYYLQAKLNILLKQVKKSLGSLRKPLLYQRNLNMSQRFVSLQQSYGSIFAAVGAAHLTGAKGMLRQIKKQGYQISPVKLENLGQAAQTEDKALV